MKDTTQDHDHAAASEQPAREWVKPELAVIPMREALSGQGFTLDGQNSYS
jgi:hypothetical protein